jgi:hypothetical protein
MEDKQVYFGMIADMVKKHNTEKADLTMVEELKEDYKENSTPLEKFRFFKDKL